MTAQAETVDELQSIRAELQALQQGQTAVQQELTEIKQMLMALQKPDSGQAEAAKPPSEPPLPMAMTVTGSPYLGQDDAPVVLIEFTDYQCPFCRRHFEQAHPRLIKEFVDTGKLKIVLKEFPLQKLHPLAPRAAMAAQCAGDQQQYWSMHDLLFQNQTRMSMEDLESFATSLELDTARFLECMEQGQYAPQIRADFDLGVSAGVRGTPFFYIGPLDQTTPGVVTVERFLYGAQPYETFAQMIEGFLSPQAAN
ncbi:DsbA family protein [Marinobacterium rhizophilum]|uniref:DsbA family protein n=1 Tax=Marinobacterium rhizophilum TaxID=420402 RepID=A0ABY5HIJ6_9GAMM|nr:thioredoxin domain-containing protein [Marinobacterium rhizophilum]UTW12192.1 DsbA family protein [Marinobacterium rhizophilum]